MSLPFNLFLETRQVTENKADRKHWEQILQNKKHKENSKLPEYKTKIEHTEQNTA